MWKVAGEHGGKGAGSRWEGKGKGKAGWGHRWGSMPPALPCLPARSGQHKQGGVEVCVRVCGGERQGKAKCKNVKMHPPSPPPLPKMGLVVKIKIKIHGGRRKKKNEIIFFFPSMSQVGEGMQGKSMEREERRRGEGEEEMRRDSLEA